MMKLAENGSMTVAVVFFTFMHLSEVYVNKYSKDGTFCFQIILIMKHIQLALLIGLLMQFLRIMRILQLDSLFRKKAKNRY